MLGVDQLVWQPTRLRAHSAVGAASSDERRHEALPRVAQTQRPMDEALDFHQARAREGGDLVDGDFTRQRHSGDTESGQRLDGRGVVCIHLRRRVNAHMRHRHPNHAQQTQVLHDHCINAGGPRGIHNLQSGVQLVRKHHDVERQVHAHPAQVREVAGIGEFVEREVLRTSTSVEDLDAEVDGIGTVRHSGPQCFGTTCGRKQFWNERRRGEHGDLQANDGVMTHDMDGAHFAPRKPQCTIGLRLRRTM